MFKRQSSTNQSLSYQEEKKSRGSKGCMIPFFSLFFLAGAGVVYWTVIGPALKILSARSWTETPCTITSSEVEVHRGDDDTYSIEIRYDYTFDGRQYHGDRYHFMIGSSSGRDGKQAVVDQYPPGLQTTCFVDPGDPSQAVINRGFTVDMWFGLLGLPFLLVGLFGLLYTLGVIGKKNLDNTGLPKAVSGADSTADDDDDFRDADWMAGSEPDGPVVLKPQWSPLTKFLGVVFIALFWNGITSVFVYQAVKSFQRGRPEWCLTFFITPFVLVGVALVFGIFHSFLALFNPRPTLVLSRARVPLGGAAELSWKFAGNAYAIKRLIVTLKGEEQATYQRGTTTHTDKEVFHTEVVFDTHDPLDIPEGRTKIRVPTDSIHSFQAAHNKIIWSIHVAGEIPLRPDVNSDFNITVTPHEQIAG